LWSTGIAGRPARARSGEKAKPEIREGEGERSPHGGWEERRRAAAAPRDGHRWGLPCPRRRPVRFWRDREEGRGRGREQTGEREELEASYWHGSDRLEVSRNHEEEATDENGVRVYHKI
jgi:hypothetical protein